MSFRRFAVGAGVEPAHSDLINDKLAGFVVNPYHLSISFSAPTRRVGVYSNGVRRFTTLQFSCPSRIRTSTNSTKNYRTTVILKGIQRKDRDSNPRTCYSCQFSRLVHSTTLPSFHLLVFPSCQPVCIFQALGFRSQDRIRTCIYTTIQLSLWLSLQDSRCMYVTIPPPNYNG